MNDQAAVVIVGGGISGLSCAYALLGRGIDVVVLEAGSRAGGTMQTLREDGWLIETGPNSALETTPLIRSMCEGIGVAGEWLYADASSKNRFILRNGRLALLPMSPVSFLRTPLWSMRGKLRLLKEPFVGRANGEETVARFVERRLGREMLDYAINPFVAGVYAGNPEELSVRSAFPKLYALEEKYGGLLMGMIRGARERRLREEKSKDRARLFSFADGMETLPAGVARMLGGRVMCGCEATSIATAYRTDGRGVRTVEAYAVSYMSGGRPHSIRAGSVVLANPAHAASGLIRPLSESLGGMLEKIMYPPVAEVFLGYKDGSFAMPLDGFGYLVPGVENRSILGTIWSSSLFPRRAPPGHAALTSFVGGARQPDLVQRSDADLVRLVSSEIRSIMGARSDPVFSRIIRWPRAIPQYNLGYHAVLEAIEGFEREHPGLFICSNYRGGIAVGDCVMNAAQIAGRAAERAGRLGADRHVQQPTGA